MEKIFKKVMKTQTATQEEMGQLLKYINLPENRKKFYLTNTSKQDRIGKYRSIVINPDEPKKRETYKIYEKQGDSDPIVYRIKYYDILCNDHSNTRKAMQLWALQKNIESAYNKELKIDNQTGEFADLRNLLDKVKKAKSYYSLKMFLTDKQNIDNKTK